MTREERKVIEECAKATRVHEKAVAGSFGYGKAVLEEVAEGLAITATKLEKLLEGEK